MFWGLFVALLAGWGIGVAEGRLYGGGLHFLLLGAALVLFLETLSQGRRVQE